MTFQFMDIGNRKGIIRTGCMELLVNANYNKSYDEDTCQTPNIKIQQILNGEKNICITYTANAGDFEIILTRDKKFILTAGISCLIFGSFYKLECDYDNNKVEINKFLNFMLQCENYLFM